MDEKMAALDVNATWELVAPQYYLPQEARSCLNPSVVDHPKRPVKHHSLVNLCLTNYLILRGLIKQCFLVFLYLGFGPNCLANSYVLRTRSPLCFYFNLKTTFDLHVLNILLAFILSQDQTLSFEYDFLHTEVGFGPTKFLI